MATVLLATPSLLYSGVSIDTKQGNITITMNSSATSASCIVVVSTFRERIRLLPQHLAPLARRPSHGRAIRLPPLG